MKLKAFINSIHQHYYFPQYSKWVFVLVFIIFSVVYNYQEILFKPPQSMHSWRQCDCLSIATGYYQDNNTFFEPSIHNLSRDGTGKTISEFPLLYFVVAKLWKVFGHHEFIYRLVVLLFFFSGLLALFKFFENVLKDSLLAIVCSMFLFTSPVLVFYANNFLMDIPAFSLALIGLYLFFCFIETSQNKYLYWCAFFYTVAGLLKVSSLLSFAAIIGLFVFELFNFKLLPGRKIFKNPHKQVFIIAGVLIIQVIWYMYAVSYNNKYNSRIFLIGILPIWDLTTTQISITFDAIRKHIKYDYFRRETQVILVWMFALALAFFKKISKPVLLLTILTATGFLIFTILFFSALKDHDYYTINLFVLAPLVLMAFLVMLKDKFSKIYTSVVFRIIALIFLIHNMDFAGRRMEDRYSIDGWYNKDYLENIMPFSEMGTYLSSLGIKKDDKVLSLSDNSVNITLYLMNRKGWTNFGIADSDTAAIKEKINQGAKYLFLINGDLFEPNSVRPFIKSKIGEFRNIDIYALHK